MVHIDFLSFIFVLDTKHVFYQYSTWEVFLEPIVPISDFHYSAYSTCI